MATGWDPSRTRADRGRRTALEPDGDRAGGGGGGWVRAADGCGDPCEADATAGDSPRRRERRRCRAAAAGRSLVDGNLGGDKSRLRHRRRAGPGATASRRSCANDHRVAQPDPEPGRNAQLRGDRCRSPTAAESTSAATPSATSRAITETTANPGNPFPTAAEREAISSTIALDQTSSQARPSRSRRPRRASCAGRGRGRPRGRPRSAARAPAGRRAGSPPCGRCSPPSACRRGR